MGRPSKLTPEVEDKLVGLVAAGNYLSTAASIVGVDVRTIRYWLAEGRSSKSGKHRRLYDRMRRASAHPEARDMHTIDKAAQSDWKAAAWRLKHRWPRRFNKSNHRHEVTGKRGEPLAQSVVLYLPDNGRLPKDDA